MVHLKKEKKILQYTARGLHIQKLLRWTAIKTNPRKRNETKGHSTRAIHTTCILPLPVWSVKLDIPFRCSDGRPMFLITELRSKQRWVATGHFYTIPGDLDSLHVWLYILLAASGLNKIYLLPPPSGQTALFTLTFLSCSCTLEGQFSQSDLVSKN